MGVRGKCISPANPATMQTDESRKQKRNNSAARGRINSFNKKELYHDRPYTETSHTRYYAQLQLYCDIFTKSSINVKPRVLILIPSLKRAIWISLTVMTDIPFPPDLNRLKSRFPDFFRNNEYYTHFFVQKEWIKKGKTMYFFSGFRRKNRFTMDKAANPC